MTVQSDLGFASLSTVVPRCRDVWRAAKRRVEGRPGSNERRFLSLERSIGSYHVGPDLVRC